MSIGQIKRAPSQRFTTEEKLELSANLAELLTLGYASTNALARQLNVDNKTVERYLPLARKVLQQLVPSREDYRAEHIARLRNVCQMILDDLARLGEDGKAYERAALYRVLGQFMGQLALVTGLNVETQVNVDQKQLVIIRNPADQRIETRQNGEIVMKDVSKDLPQRATSD